MTSLGLCGIPIPPIPPVSHFLAVFHVPSYRLQLTFLVSRIYFYTLPPSAQIEIVKKQYSVEELLFHFNVQYVMAVDCIIHYTFFMHVYLFRGVCVRVCVASIHDRVSCSFWSC